MKSRIFSIILSVFLFSQISFAQLCARLVDVRAGEDHILAVSEDGFLFSCGGGDGGMALGLGGTSQVYSFQRVHGPNNVGYLKNIEIFDTGWYHSLAVDSNGVFWSFGNDTSGQLGNGDEGSYSVPIRVHGLNNDANGLRNIVMVSAGRSGTHSLAVDSNGYVYGFGNNSSYQCGDESDTQRQYPVLVVDSCDQTTGIYLGDEAFIVDVEAGVSHSVALVRFEDGGFVYEWGNGYSYKTPRKVPGENGVGFLRNVVDIATCGYSLAADSNGNVWRWDVGGNPTRIPGGQMGTEYLENIVKVAAGSSVYAALDANGNVWELQSGYPVKITDGQQNSATGYLEGIVALDVGYYDQRVVIDEYGHGFGWGNNRYGSLGIGNISSPTEPTEMLCADAAPSVYFEKTYEIQGLEPNCAKPFIGWGIDDNYIVFEISYGNPITNPSDPNYIGTVPEVNIIDNLPIEMEYYSSDPCGIYDSNSRTVRWNIGNLAPGDEGVISLTVTVNDYAKPCGQIINTCQLSGDGYWTYTDVNVPVCPWGGEIIYVDQDANGCNNGTDWQNAYNDLRDAFTQARSSCAEVTAIWVANGSYQPVYDINETDYQNKSFELIQGVGLFGHFAGGEESLDERNFADANNETILEGKVGNESYQGVYKIVKAENIEDGIIDGFTIRDSYSGAGIYLDDSDVSIVNCKIRNNSNYGIQAINYSYTDIHNCLFVGNSSQNINSTNHCWPVVSYCTFDGNDTTSDGVNISSYTDLDVENSIFKDHTSDGINASGRNLNVTSCKFESNNSNGLELNNVTTTITKSSIKNSNYSGLYANNGCNLVLKNSIISYSGNRGVEISDGAETTILNNWIHHNGTNHSSSEGAGVYSSNHTVNKLLLRNNTIYDNYTYGIECGQYGADPNICNCIIVGNDSNDLYRLNGSFNKVNYSLLQHTHSGTGNKTGDPGFVNIEADEDDLHIDIESQCVDAGDPNGNYDETDIDDEPRITSDRVDIGGDEIYISPADFTGDGIVSWDDLFVLCEDWLEAVEGTPDIVDNNFIDFVDFAAFAKDWQWKAPWPDIRVLLSEDFESGIPGSWTVVNGGSSAHTWTTDNTTCQRSSQYWNGNFCKVDSDCAGTVDMNEILITPAIDCTDALEVTLKFSHHFDYYSGGPNEKGDVDISVNNGPWQNLLQYTGSSAEGNIEVDISEYAVDQSNIRIRWHYYNANYDNYWGIDNVQIIGNYRLAGGMQMCMGGGSLLKSVMLESSILDIAVPVDSSDELMISSAAESLAKRPARLTEKSQKFYDLVPSTTTSAKQKELESIKNEKYLANVQAKQTLQTESAISLTSEQIQAEPIFDVNSILNWLDELWKTDEEIRKSMTEEEYLEFRKSIEDSDSF